jgi:hypothetical protein
MLEHENAHGPSQDAASADIVAFVPKTYCYKIKNFKNGKIITGGPLIKV